MVATRSSDDSEAGSSSNWRTDRQVGEELRCESQTVADAAWRELTDRRTAGLSLIEPDRSNSGLERLDKERAASSSCLLSQPPTKPLVAHHLTHHGRPSRKTKEPQML